MVSLQSIYTSNIKWIQQVVFIYLCTYMTIAINMSSSVWEGVRGDMGWVGGRKGQKLWCVFYLELNKYYAFTLVSILRLCRWLGCIMSRKCDSVIFLSLCNSKVSDQEEFLETLGKLVVGDSHSVSSTVSLQGLAELCINGLRMHWKSGKPKGFC